MSEPARLADELRRAYDGDPWHGPSIRAALEHVDFAAAMARPFPDGHTIAELVQHMTAWTREVTRRLDSLTARDPADGDWPAVLATNDAEWQGMVNALGTANAALAVAVERLDDGQLQAQIGDDRVPALGSGVTRYVTLHGLAQHHAYHAGQIALLRKWVSAARA